MRNWWHSMCHAEEAQAEAEDRLERRPGDDLRPDRLEPALDAAHQPVVFESLVVRLVLLHHEALVARARRQRGVAPPAITVAVGQMGVERHVGPARGEGVPVGERAVRGELAPHAVRRHEREPFKQRCGHRQPHVIHLSN
jgi:hypothetical protein